MIEAAYMKKGVVATAWRPKRETGIPDPSDEVLSRFVVTSVRIHSWVYVTLGAVEIRTIFAIQLGPFRSPQLELIMPEFFRDDAMVFPEGNKSFWRAHHIIADKKNDSLYSNRDKQFLRAGLWHSAFLAGCQGLSLKTKRSESAATLVGHESKLYVVPHGDLKQLASDLKSVGEDAFQKYDSFDDPSLPFTQSDGSIDEPKPVKRVRCRRCESVFVPSSERKCPSCGAFFIMPKKRSRSSGASFAAEIRPDWSLQRYAQAIATTACQGSGLERHRNYVRALGKEIDKKWGFDAMQKVWHAIHDSMGPGPCSDLTRIWDGVGCWQK